MPASVYAILATAAMAIACATLSVFVVARRWAFIGEGIAHSGFGGAGLAWLLMLAFPFLERRAGFIYLSVVLFCLGTALAIGFVTRGTRINSDAAIGIFMVASLAFGFLAQQIFLELRGGEPPGFGELLFGRFSGIDPRQSIAAICVCAAVVVTVLALFKEILYYCLDPLAAQTSGVPAGFIHYLLMVLIALTIVIGIPITGSVLVTALLVLPGTTANLLSRRLGSVIALSVAVGLVGAVGGVLVSLWAPLRIPAGPAIVLLLFVLFLLTWALTRRRIAD